MIIHLAPNGLFWGKPYLKKGYSPNPFPKTFELGATAPLMNSLTLVLCIFYKDESRHFFENNVSIEYF